MSKNNYTVLPNELFTNSLSIEAIGLATFLHSLEKGSMVPKIEIQKKFNLTKDELDKLLLELKNYLYYHGLNITILD